jgi:hypothetical protein
MKTLLAALAGLTLVFTAHAKDKAPSGYYGLDELSKAQEKAKASKKLIAILAKGENDACPLCAAAMGTGGSALKSDCVMVFTRSESLASANLPQPVKNGMAGSPTGAAVTFVVFNPELTEVVVKMGRDEINNNRKTISDAKKAIKEAEKKYFAAK